MQLHHVLDLQDGFPFHIEYATDAPDARSFVGDDVLAIIRFGRPVPCADPRIVTVPLSELGGGQTLEVWRSPEPVHTGTRDDVSYTCNRHVLFGYIRHEDSGDQVLEAATCDVYQRAYALATALGYPHICRVWNFFPDINADGAGLERYRMFCRGRHCALSKALCRFEQSLPAASAIGTRLCGLVVYFLATPDPGCQIENPRQMSAFQYPAQYGPKSPSFSRSVLKSWGGRSRHLYISGTASIVGHATRHAGNFARQLQEILDNVEALREAANGLSPVLLRLERLRAYLREESREVELRAAIAARLGPVPLLVLGGDICRADLSLEIEGLAVAG